MNKAELGNKLFCQSCGAKFYDFKKKKPVCPKCDTAFEEVKTKPRRAPVAEAVVAPKPVVEAKVEADADDETAVDDGEDVPVEDDDDGEDNTLIEDTSDIGGDEEDIGEVIAVVDSGDKE